MNATLHWLERAARFFTILIPVLIVAGPAPGDIGVALIALLFLVRSVLTRDASWLKARWVQLLLVLWVYMCWRNSLLPEDSGLIRSASWLRYPLFAIALGHWLLPHAGTTTWLRRTLVAAVAFLAFDALWQYAFGTDLTGRPGFVYQGSIRLTGPYSAPRVGITILWLMFPAIFWCIAQPEHRTKWLGALLALGAGLAIFTSGERMALVLLGIGVVATLLVLPRVRKPLLAAAVLAIALAFGLMHANPLLKARQVGETSREVADFGGSAYGRTWTSAWRIGLDHPVIGVGSKQFREVCADAKYGATDAESLRLRCVMHPHNMYLEWLVEYGFIGLGLFAAALAAWAALALRHWHQWWGNPLAMGVMLTLALRLWPISVVTSQFVSWSAVPFWLLVGWAIAILGKPNNNA